MNTYKYFSDLPLLVKESLFEYLKSSDFIDYNTFEADVSQSDYNYLNLLIETYGSYDINEFGKEEALLITDEFVLVSHLLSDTSISQHMVDVYSKKEFEDRGYIKIPKSEYDRLLQIEKFYNALNNDN